MNKFKAIALALMGLLYTNTAIAHGMSEADKQKILDAGYWEYIELGTTHMLTGYDHLLFLFGVMFFLTSFRDIVKFITAFTVGHSITLVFATLYGIQANYYIIDAIIALTVCYKAFDNLDGFKKYLSMKSPNLLAMVFGFGLIHGFGLSTRLQQLPLGDDAGLIGRILAFNVGVEVGQIIALSAMLVILSIWRKRESFKKFSKASNVALAFTGFMLLLMQLHGYNHTKHVEDYPLNKDDHYHVHKEWEARSNKANLQKVKAQKAEEKPVKQKTHSHDGVTHHSH